EVTCSICLDLFKDPVTAECGHSFCRECITQHCEEKEIDIVCPQCRQTFQKSNLRPNRELKNIVELINLSSRLQRDEEPGGGSRCEKHDEPLKLFCKNDQTPICVICRESRAHRAHTVVPMEEAVQECRETIMTNLEIIESTCEELRLLDKKDWKHLPQSLSEEETERLMGVMEKV
ncbi:tripartite motif containing 27, partial [Chelydra serpentina]